MSDQTVLVREQGRHDCVVYTPVPTPPTNLESGRRFYGKRIAAIINAKRARGETWTPLGATKEEKRETYQMRANGMRALVNRPEYRALSSTAKLLFTMLVNQANCEEHAWLLTIRGGANGVAFGMYVGVERMMQHTARSRRTVLGALAELTAAGFMLRKRTKGKAITFVVIPNIPPTIHVQVSAPLDVQVSAPVKASTEERNLKQFDSRPNPHTVATSDACAGARRFDTRSNSELEQDRTELVAALLAAGINSRKRAHSMCRHLRTYELHELLETIEIIRGVDEHRSGRTPQQTAAWLAHTFDSDEPVFDDQHWARKAAGTCSMPDDAPHRRAQGDDAPHHRRAGNRS